MDACNERSAQRWWPRRGERGGGDQERLQLVEGARQLGVEEEERLLGAPEEREGGEPVAHHLAAKPLSPSLTISARNLAVQKADNTQMTWVRLPLDQLLVASASRFQWHLS